MRHLVIAATLPLALTLSACGGGSSSSKETTAGSLCSDQFVADYKGMTSLMESASEALAAGVHSETQLLLRFEDLQNTCVEFLARNAGVSCETESKNEEGELSQTRLKSSDLISVCESVDGTVKELLVLAKKANGNVKEESNDSDQNTSAATKDSSAVNDLSTLGGMLDAIETGSGAAQQPSVSNPPSPVAPTVNQKYKGEDAMTLQDLWADKSLKMRLKVLDATPLQHLLSKDNLVTLAGKVNFVEAYRKKIAEGAPHCRLLPDPENAAKSKEIWEKTLANDYEFEILHGTEGPASDEAFRIVTVILGPKESMLGISCRRIDLNEPILVGEVREALSGIVEFSIEKTSGSSSGSSPGSSQASPQANPVAPAAPAGRQYQGEDAMSIADIWGDKSLALKFEVVDVAQFKHLLLKDGLIAVGGQVNLVEAHRKKLAGGNTYCMLGLDPSKIDQSRAFWDQTIVAGYELTAVNGSEGAASKQPIRVLSVAFASGEELLGLNCGRADPAKPILLGEIREALNGILKFSLIQGTK